MTTKDKIIEYIISKGFTKEEAEKIYQVYTSHKVNALRIDVYGGWSFTHGAFGDKEVLSKALNYQL